MPHRYASTDELSPSLQGESAIRLRSDLGEFQLRVLEESFFVVESDPIVRGHDPNQLGRVIHAVLVSDFCDDIRIAYRVTATHDRLAQCIFVDLPDSEQTQIGQLIRLLEPITQSKQSSPTTKAAGAHTQSQESGQSKTASGDESEYHQYETESDKLKYALAAVALALVTVLVLLGPGENIVVRDGHLSGVQVAVQPDNGQRTRSQSTDAPNPIPNSSTNPNDATIALADHLRADHLQANHLQASALHTAERNDHHVNSIDPIDVELLHTKQELHRWRARERATLQAIEMTKKRLDNELRLAQVELESINLQADAAKARLDRVAPLIKDNNIGASEVEEIRLAVSNAAVQQKKQLLIIEKLQFERDAADQDAIIQANGISYPLSEIQSMTASLQTYQNRLRRQRDQIAGSTADVTDRESVAKSLHVMQSDDVSLRRPPGDQNVAGVTWASGYVSTDDSQQVEPGQVVQIDVPARGLKLQGTVASVGNADDDPRGDGSVAIAVRLQSIHEEIQPGEPLEMSIETDTGFRKWVRGIFTSNPTVVPQQSDSTP
ncbi:MAG: hypothetical protein HKN47_03835 [Pirellulaceae bacterium]|nr:hypothetical protein [Pirellulaceae bacterium]